MALYGSDNLQFMRGRVKDQKPNAPADSCDAAINRRIRQVCNKRAWTDLIRFGSVAIPDEYTTGTVAVVSGSTTVTGSATAWPTNDFVNTTVVAAIRNAGTQMVQPASMANIAPGRYLYIDSAGTPEVVCVLWVNQQNTQFVANFQNAHAANFTVKASTLAGRQFRASSQLFTVTAVPTATSLILDLPWGTTSASAQNYQILAAYFQIDPNARRLIFAWDYAQGVALDVDTYTLESVLIGDPQITSATNPTMAVPVPPTPGGTNQWMFYPPQSAARQIGVIWLNTWPRLMLNGDLPPGFIDPECYVAGAKADLLKIKVLERNMRDDPYYDPALALTFDQEFQQYLADAEEADEAQSHHRLQSYQSNVLGGLSADYYRSHPGWPTEYSPW